MASASYLDKASYLNADFSFNRVYIMAQAWERAKQHFAYYSNSGSPYTLQDLFAGALKWHWQAARGYREMAIYTRNEELAQASMDARRREIANLETARFCASMSDCGTTALAEMAAIDRQLAVLRAAA